METADRLRYVPNNVARSLRAQATGAVGVLISDLANPFYAEVARGIEQVLRARGYQMLLADSDGLADQESAALRTFQTMRVEGVILTPGNALVRPCGLPCEGRTRRRRGRPAE